MSKITFELNGSPVTAEVSEDDTALDVLRDRLGQLVLKDGCAPQGACGCCTVAWDGRPVMACLRRGSKLEGAQITTLDGISPHKREVLAKAFVATAGLQCGFCIPGIATRAVSLLDKNPSPSDGEIRSALKANLCRCTGYTKIVDAIELAGKHWNTDTIPVVSQESHIGSRAKRYDGDATVLGTRLYVNDMSVPDMLHGAIRLSDHPRARVLAMDTSKAEAMEGVVCVMTAADLHAGRTTGTIESDWPVFIGVGEVTQCIGSSLAAVAAVDRKTARAAAAAIEIEYEVLEPLTDTHAALAEGAPEVHPGRSNLLRTTTVRRGDVDALLAASAHVITETFYTQRIEHAFLEPEASLVLPMGEGGDGGVHVYTQGQGVHEDRHQIAEVLGLPVDKVLVELVANGGAFGGKEDLSIQHHAALLTQRLKRPVLLALSRDESMRLHPKRHPIEMTYTVGCDKDGRLTAMRARMWGDTGGYASVGDKVLERAAGHACGAYKFAAVDVQAHTVYTNNVVCGAFRGFGANQAAFAIEGMVDRLAERVGLDGYDIRDLNIIEKGDLFGPGQIMGDEVGIRPTLEAVRELYKSSKRVGIACGVKNTGIGNGLNETGRALILVDGPDHVTVYTGFTEMGQGLLTIVQQVVCHETGLSLDQISVEISTRHEVECGMTTASRGTMLTAEAVRRATVPFAEALRGATLGDLLGQSYHGEFINDSTTKPEDGPHTHMTFGFATQVVLLDEEGRLEKVVAVHDVGRIMNRSLCEGQIEGAVHMGLGYALSEDLPSTGGFLDSTKLRDLHILSASHTPQIEVQLVEIPDPLTKYGVKGVGEIGLVPTAPAVAAALKAHDGIWRTTLPMRGSAAARAVLPKKLHEDNHP